MGPAAMARLHEAAMRIPRPWTEAEFAALLLSRGVFAVARDHAFAIARVAADEAELLTIAVDPARQGQGLGRDCLAAFHDMARTKGAEHAFLEVAAANARARALYAAAGYGQVGLRKGYYRDADGQSVDALVLRRQLRD